MPALPVIGSVVALATTTAIIVATIVVVCLATLLIDWIAMSPFDHMLRERRCHAKRTARSVRRMSEIRRQTIERMDRAERWRS